jgi:hypothetical protein
MLSWYEKHCNKESTWTEKGIPAGRESRASESKEGGKK